VPATLQRYNCTTEFLLGSVKGFTEFWLGNVMTLQSLDSAVPTAPKILTRQGQQNHRVFKLSSANTTTEFLISRANDTTEFYINSFSSLICTSV
jgi:hypothetical protein